MNHSNLETVSGQPPVCNTFLFTAVICGILYGLYTWSLFAFLFFAYGTSFAHFVLDGLIWKLRRPKVTREVGAI